MSDGLPGSVYDLTAARTHGILDTCRRAGLQLVANRAHSAIRCLVERGIATLKNWRVLTQVRARPRYIAYGRTLAGPDCPVERCSRV